MRLLALLIVALPAAAALPACSSSSTPNACKAYVTPSDFNAAAPVVSFKTDVWPIFHGSCAFSSCHGSENGGNQAGLYLGNDTAKIYAALVNIPAQNYGSMARITPNDAKNSYLMHKIDGDSCTLASCTGVCANTMPDDNPVEQATLMDLGKRDTIRRWILQGAPNN